MTLIQASRAKTRRELGALAGKGFHTVVRPENHKKHRPFEAGRASGYHLVLLLKAGSARAGHSGLCPIGFVSQDADYTASLGNLLQCLVVHSKKFF